MKKLICFYLLLIINSLSAQIPEGWNIIKESNFLAAFPSIPDSFKEKKKIGGYDVKTSTWLVAEENMDRQWARCFCLIYHDYPSEYFQNFRKMDFLDSLKKTVLADTIFSVTRNIGLKKFPKSGIEFSGYNFIIKNINSKKHIDYFIVRFYLIGNRLYRLYASEIDSQPYNARLFLNSFEVYSE